jgi:hypothetical protein
MPRPLLLPVVRFKAVTMPALPARDQLPGNRGVLTLNIPRVASRPPKARIWGLRLSLSSLPLQVLPRARPPAEARARGKSTGAKASLRELMTFPCLLIAMTIELPNPLFDH